MLVRGLPESSREDPGISCGAIGRPTGGVESIARGGTGPVPGGPVTGSPLGGAPFVGSAASSTSAGAVPERALIARNRPATRATIPRARTRIISNPISYLRARGLLKGRRLETKRDSGKREHRAIASPTDLEGHADPVPEGEDHGLEPRVRREGVVVRADRLRRLVPARLHDLPAPQHVVRHEEAAYEEPLPDRVA